MMRSHSSWGISAIGTPTPTPALLTSTSSPPNFATAVRTASSAEAASRTSQTIAATVPERGELVLGLDDAVFGCAGDRHLVTGAQQRFGQRVTDAARAAGDQHDSRHVFHPSPRSQAPSPL